MLIPIIGLYFYSNHTASDVVRKELNESNMNQLVFFQNQVNSNIDILASWPNLLIHDPDVKSFQEIYLNNEHLNLDGINLIKRIQDKISLQQSSSNWRGNLSVYSPSLQRVVTEQDARSYSAKELQPSARAGWQVQRYESSGDTAYLFSWYTAAPFTNHVDPKAANTIIKVEFDSSNIQEMLDRFKSDGRRDPFYYRQDQGIIYNHSADRPFIRDLVAQLKGSPLKKMENRTVEMDGQSYTVSLVRSQVTGWYMIDYLPLSEIMKPIASSNRLFYFSVGILLLMSILAAYLLYSHVQVPLRQLIYGFHRVTGADYSYRMHVEGNNEFSFLSSRFNSMVEQIQELFEKVYLEKIHVREARLKQLQSQINPHFFYNCFSFITSMAKLRKHEAVVAMSHSLSRYYRYTTRQERDLVPLEEEMEFVKHYLEIQTMRMNRLTYDMYVPENCRKLQIPPLLIQPLIENAILHGIEPHAEEGIVRILVSRDGDCIRVIVEDNGGGMDKEDLLRLETRLNEPMDEHMGCGLWNVQQRLRLRFGDTAGIFFSRSELGGLRAQLVWTLPEET
ncbi:sensor histidine kinase [Paenibacillus sp. JX-17]|uniref:Sensor histidine kinase n=2 Tax=Paenibacillus lacisoli TaxID=3064525 RepID=A0ABT9CJX7_9BACL|nr:sensor histidine kinase [Paenibacillus sp. JX-17]MDO7907918.1 sensor histidine kinase [Paenibacillus sp. JX-17]